jgi:hypothetical protein
MISYLIVLLLRGCLCGGLRREGERGNSAPDDERDRSTESHVPPPGIAPGNGMLSPDLVHAYILSDLAVNLQASKPARLARMEDAHT